MMGALGLLVLAGMMLAFLVCYKRPSLAFVLVLALFPLKQLQMTYMGIFAQHSSYFNFIVFACVASGALGCLSGGRGAFMGYGNRVFYGLAFLYAYAIIALLYTPAPENALARMKEGAPYWLMQVALLPLVIVNIEDVRKTFNPALFIGIIVIILFLTNPNRRFSSGRMMLFIPGTEYYGNPLATAQMGAHIAIIAALMLPARTSMLINGARLVAILLGLGLALAAGSRGQLALAVIAMILFYPMARRVANIKQFFLTVAGLGVTGLVILLALKLFLGQDAEQTARWDFAEWVRQFYDRFGQAMILLEAWAQRPIAWPFGLGTNAYSYYSGVSLSYAHNAIIEMLGEYGLFGLTVYFFIFAWMYKDCKAIWLRYADDPVYRATAACLVAQCFFLTGLSYKQGALIGAPEPYYLWAIIAKIAAQARMMPAMPQIPAYAPYDSDPAQEAPEPVAARGA